MEKKRDSFFLATKKGKDKKQAKDQKEELKKKRHNHFNKNRVGVENGQGNEDTTEKKPFDKKTYRLKKYSKKYKLEQWEEQRKKRLMRDYQKSVKNDPLAGSYKPVSFDEDNTDSQEVGRFVKHPDLLEKGKSSEQEETQEQKKKDPFWKAKEKYNKVKQDKLEKQQQIEKAREEKKQRLEEYKKKKQERFKKLSKKTKKGQPVMTGRLELLLEQIQKGSK